MKLLLITAMIWTTASARPEMYKENEDFQYSRSSTDEGSKSGYYGAQRGNMGGNYERAHNMDGLAQHQMSGLIKQVDGELGEGHNTRTGDVFAAANSRGTYGSGKYDLGNLQGRNFGEGTHVDNSHSSLSSHNAGYTGQLSSHSSGYSRSSQLQNSRYSGYQGSDSYGRGLQSSNLQSQDNMHAASAYGAREQSGYNSGHYTQSAYQGQGSLGSSNANQYSSSVYPQNRLVWTVPVRVVGRPGSRVAIPVGVENYDAAQSATSFDQNAIKSEAEILNNANTQTEYQPSKSARRYESSYNYRKQWEKHDTKPEVVVLSMPTENPLPENSELHEDATSLNSHNSYQASNSHKSNVQSAYNTNSESSQSRQYSGHNSQYSGSSGANSNAYTQDTHNTGSSDVANVVSDVNSKPKSYHSSYSYHKSWERQGDPYEIKPVVEGTTGLESQRLTSATNNAHTHAHTNNQGFASHRYGNQYHQSHQSYSSQNDLATDCVGDEQVRVTRSVEQQSQPNLIDLGNTGQQTQDLNQGFSQPDETRTWNENFRQQGQDFIKPDFGQETENLGQQSQNNWDSSFNKLEDLEQQNQDLGQRTQNSWGQGFDKLEDLGQQNQDLGQQSQNNWNTGFDKLQDLGQQNQDLGQQTQNGWGQGLNKLEGFDQHTQNLKQRTQDSWVQGLEGQSPDIPYQRVNQWDNLQNLGQQSKSEWSF